MNASLRCAAWVAACCAWWFAGAAQAVVAPLGPTYPVSDFAIEYALDHPRHIPAAELLDLEVGLSSAGVAYTAPRPVDRTVRMRLSSLPDGAVLSATAIQHINQYIVSAFNRAGYQGVIVTVPDIDEATGRDLRAGGETLLRLRVWTGRVSRLATLAEGKRFASLSVDERTNHTAHEWIRERAPVQPGGLRGLLDVASLDEYAAAMSRHRGRRVDAELGPGSHPGTSDVTLRVTENRPWSVYAQYSNTGTSNTSKNRQRFGFVHDQLLGRDDILRVDYATGDFDEVHAVNGSYEAPFSMRFPGVRYRVRGMYSQFDASEVGFVDSPPGVLSGEQLLGEGSVVVNALQRGRFFLDVSAGARYHHVEVDQKELLEISTDPTQPPGSQTVDPGAILRQEAIDFWVPTIGVLGERRSRVSTLRLAVDADLGLTSAREEDLIVLGNPNPDDTFVTLRWDGSYSFYLEPLIDRFAWEDPSTPESSTLAHEVALALRGQWAFDHRLVPQYQRVAGGFYSVRGYKQAAVAGDSVVLGTAEYRFHLPRVFDPDPQPPRIPAFGEFRTRPESVYGRPDWNMILRLFSDAGRAFASDPIDSEQDETLFSVGAGVEMQLLSNLSLRFDAGHVLSNAGSSENGDTRGHVLATLAY